jgi:hypothetical protein
MLVIVERKRPIGGDLNEFEDLFDAVQGNAA